MRFNFLKMFQGGGGQSSRLRRRREKTGHGIPGIDVDDVMSDRFDGPPDSVYMHGYQSVGPVIPDMPDGGGKLYPPPIEVALPSRSPRKPIIDDDDSFIQVDSPTSPGVIPVVYREESEGSRSMDDGMSSGSFDGRKHLPPPQRIASRYTPSDVRERAKAARYTEDDVIVLSASESYTRSDSTENVIPRVVSPQVEPDRMHPMHDMPPQRMNYAPETIAQQPTVVFTNSMHESARIQHSDRRPRTVPAEIRPPQRPHHNSTKPIHYIREPTVVFADHKRHDDEYPERVVAIPSTTSSSVYYIVPGGMNVIFQDEDGHEITRVGDFSGMRRRARSAPFIVQDKHGREIYRYGKIDESAGKSCPHRGTCREIEGHLLVLNPCRCKSSNGSYSRPNPRVRSGSGASSNQSGSTHSGKSERYVSEIISGPPLYRSDSPRSHHSRHSSQASSTLSGNRHRHDSSAGLAQRSRHDHYDHDRDRDHHNHPLGSRRSHT